MPLIPVIIYGGGALLVGSASYGVYKGASESARSVMLVGGLVGLGYLIYKRKR